MTQSPPAPARLRGRIPPFHAVPGKARSDGWTPLKQAEFIGELAETRSVSEAARRVGMARETAYRLRRRKWSASFCAAWDAAIGSAPLPLRPAFADAGVRKAQLARLGLSAPAMDFRAANAALAASTTPAAKVTIEELRWRCDTGLWQVLLHRGKYIGVRRKADNSALFRLLASVDRASLQGQAPASQRQRSRV
ncbi:hypothetical protein WAB17_02920 [Parerythrobacter aurantius]|uniref:hypothetical protein n=1 Tax=Parerythrobacter aurantius TaxID=3127706 RepID=UPI003254E3D1